MYTKFNFCNFAEIIQNMVYKQNFSGLNVPQNSRSYAKTYDRPLARLLTATDYEILECYYQKSDQTDIKISK